MGKYENLSFDTAKVDVEYSASEHDKQRASLLSNGISASMVMDKLKE